MPISIAGSGAVTGASTLNGLTVPSDAIAPGLVLINKTDFVSAASISINGCFSTSYNNYKIVIDCLTTIAGGVDFQFRLRASGADISTSSYYYGHNYITASGGPTRGYGGPVTLAYMGYIGDYTGIMSMDITSPFLAKNKSMHCQYSGPGTSQAYYGSLYSLITSTASCDGITIYPSSGTTTGTIRIYGYRNA